MASAAVVASSLLVTAASCQLGDSTSPKGSAGFSRAWFAPSADSNEWAGTPAVAGNAVIVAVRGGLAAFDTGTGAPLWKATLLASPAWRMFPGNIVIQGGVACAVNRPGVGCVDRTTGQVLWKTATDSANDLANASADDQQLYYGTRHHRVVALGLHDGGVRWTTDIAPGAPFATRVFGTAVRGDTVYAATVRWLTSNGHVSTADLLALDARTGQILWRYSPAAGDTAAFQEGPVLAGNLAIVSDVDYHGLRAIDLTTHQEVWRSAKDESGYIDAETAPVVVGDTVFAASTDMKIYALDRRTGIPFWRAEAADGSLYSVAACGQHLVTTLFAGGDPHAVNRATKRATRGRFLEAGDYIASGVTAAGDMAYAVGVLGIYGMRCSRS